MAGHASLPIVDVTPPLTAPPLSVGVVKLASCDGCQLALLGLGPLLLDLGTHFRIIEFGEASSDRSDGPYDLLLVEGSVSTDEQAHHLRSLRERSGLLVTIGACATSGGIQALRGWARDAVAPSVYPEPTWVDALPTVTPVADHVRVDAELRGCPIDGGQLVELLTALRVGRRPQLPDEAVCAACKRVGTVCVVVAHGEPCLGPLTRTGCGAICPAWGRGCYACFGPREDANVAGLAAGLAGRGLDDATLARRLSLFTAWSAPFRAAIDARGGPPGFPTTSADATHASGPRATDVPTPGA
ncbi:MAG: oxidoreductase [Chloroflexi bacterium]|nr:oxidoreductase [Chloroflexota bacterium]